MAKPTYNEQLTVKKWGLGAIGKTITVRRLDSLDKTIRIGRMLWYKITIIPANIGRIGDLVKWVSKKREMHDPSADRENTPNLYQVRDEPNHPTQFVKVSSVTDVDEQFLQSFGAEPVAPPVMEMLYPVIGSH